MATVHNAFRISAIAILLLHAACGGSPAQEIGSGPAQSGPSATQLPASLVGVWRLATASANNYIDPSTGHIYNGSGGSMSYTFEANGHFVAALLQETAVYGCWVTKYQQWEGTASAAATTIALDETKNLERGDGNCGAHTYSTTVPEVRETVAWKIVDASPDPRQLWLKGAADADYSGPFKFQSGSP